MSKIPSFGFKSKLKAPAFLKVRSGNSGTNSHVDATNGNVDSVQGRPSRNSGSDIASYSSQEESCVNDADADREQKVSGNITRRSASKENLEQTSNNLSKLADKLNAGTSTAASGVTSKIPPKPAFRRKGSSNIAKLNSGKGKERSGATQIHGQTPYTKTPRVDSKPPLGMTKNGTEAETNSKKKLCRLSGIPGSRGFVRKEDDKEAENGNETFSMPSKKQKGETGQPSGQAQGKTSSTTTALRRSSGGALKSGLRPPSGSFTGIATGASVPRAETKMKPPSIPATGPTVNSKAGINDSKTVDARGFVTRRNSGQEATIVKRNSKENLRASNIATPRQRVPSKELQTMAEKLKSYTGKRLQRPTSVSSEVDLRKSALKPKDRKSLNATNLRTVNSSSLQEISRKSSNDDTSMKKALHRSSSCDRSTKDKKSLSSALSDGNKDGQVFAAQTHTSKQAFGLKKPRPRSDSKTFSSTNSEFGIHDNVNGEPYQSTPVSKTVLRDSAPDGCGHPFENALNATFSGVFEEGCVPNDANEKNSPLHCRRVLNETFDGKGHNTTFDSAPVKHGTFTAEACLPLESSADDVVGGNDTFCKQPRPNETFEVEAKNEVISASSMESSDSYSLTKYSQDLGDEAAKLSKVEGIEAGETDDKVDSLRDENTLSIASIDSCKAIAKQKSAGRDLEELIDGYHSDDFLLNETMPTLDGSFAISVPNEIKGSVSPSLTNKHSKMHSDSEEPHNQEGDRGAIEVASLNDAERPKSVSRELNFEGVPKHEGNVDDKDGILATSLIDDSYDVVTIEEASGSGEQPEEAKNVTSEIVEGSVAKDSISKEEPLDRTSELNPGSELIDVEASQLNTESIPNGAPHEIEKMNSKDERPPVNSEEVEEAGKTDSCASQNTPNRFQIPLCNEKAGMDTDPKKSTNEKDFSSLLSQTVENMVIGNDKKVQENKGNGMIVNLLTPEDSSDAVKEIFDSFSSNTNQMKMASRRRTLVRRNTSPYMTSSVPDSSSSGTIFRIPRETSIAETSDGNVIMDESAYRHCQNDVRMIKTNLLRLKRVLQEMDIMSPFAKHSSQFASSPPVTPTRATVLSRSFSDASSWLTRMKKAEVPLGSEQMNQKPKASLNRTDEDKVKDEINDLKENQCRLERELEEAKHDLESKNNTIKLLQTQLEHQEYMEQIELLLEEKIMLFEENQELKERIEELENEGALQSSSVKSSIKEQYLKQSNSGSKIRSEIVKGYYEEN